jgi:hypothetical protein
MVNATLPLMTASFSLGLLSKLAEHFLGREVEIDFGGGQPVMTQEPLRRGERNALRSGVNIKAVEVSWKPDGSLLLRGKSFIPHALGLGLASV